MKQEEQRMEDLEFKHGQQKLADLDKKFFAYSDEVYNLAKDYGRPTMPIERVIEVSYFSTLKLLNLEYLFYFTEI